MHYYQDKNYKGQTYKEKAILEKRNWFANWVGSGLGFTKFENEQKEDNTLTHTQKMLKTTSQNLQSGAYVSVTTNYGTFSHTPNSGVTQNKEITPRFTADEIKEFTKELKSKDTGWDPTRSIKVPDARHWVDVRELKGGKDVDEFLRAPSLTYTAKSDKFFDKAEEPEKKKELGEYKIGPQGQLIKDTDAAYTGPKYKVDEKGNLVKIDLNEPKQSEPNGPQREYKLERVEPGKEIMPVFDKNAQKQTEQKISSGTEREKTIVYHPNTEIILYEGEILNKMFDGKGKVWHRNGTLKYEGEFRRGGPHGENILIYDETGRINYDGDMYEGKKHGEGKIVWPNGELMFEGAWRNDGPDDDGQKVCIYFDNGRPMYKGRMEAGVRNGVGTSFFRNGTIQFEGNWLDNMPDGDSCQIFDQNGSMVHNGRLVRGVGRFAGEIVYKYMG